MLDKNWIRAEYWFRLCENNVVNLLIGSIVILLASMTFSLYLSPIDYQQGTIYRILYVHVPASVLSLALYCLLAITSLTFLTTHISVFDLFSNAIARVGALFTMISIFTGAMWGKPTWGTWWIWDARLTSQFLLFSIYLIYIIGKNSIVSAQKARVYFAVFAIIGLIDIPIIHFSVEWWQTLHQAPTVLKFSKPSMDPKMLWILIINLISYFFFAITLILLALHRELYLNCRHKKWFTECLQLIPTSI